jgi:hypothetical protein
MVAVNKVGMRKARSDPCGSKQQRRSRKHRKSASPKDSGTVRLPRLVLGVFRNHLAIEVSVKRTATDSARNIRREAAFPLRIDGTPRGKGKQNQGRGGASQQ